MAEAIEESLGFDISPALAGIAQIDDALTQVVQSFAVGLAQALETLTGVSVQLGDQVDASGLTTSIEAAAAEAIATVEGEQITLPVEGDAAGLDSSIADTLETPRPPVEVGGDTSALDDAIAGEASQAIELGVEGETSALDQAIAGTLDEPRPPVPVEGDTAGLDSAIESATVGTSATVSVEGDTSGLDAAISAEAGQSVEVGVSGDTSGLESSISDAGQTPVEVGVSADTGDAQDQIAGLAAERVEVGVDADTAALDDAIAAEAGQTIEVAVEGDASDLDRAIADALDEPRPPVSVEGDTSGLDQAIEAATAGATATVAVEGDTAGLDAAIDSEAGQTVEVAVTGDTSALIDAIVGLTDVIGELVVRVSADTSEAQDQIAALSGETVQVGIDVDTAGAQDAIDGLAGSAAEGSAGLEGLKGSAEGLGIAAGLAEGSVGELGGAVEGLGGGLGIAAGGAATFAGFLGVVTRAGADAEAQQKRFNATFGDSAALFEDIDVGGLVTSLDELGKVSGTENANLQATATRIGLIGQASGATQAATAGVASQILALAGATSVANPRLGDTSAVADRLTQAFVTGRTRALVPYGIALTQAAITQEALRENVGKTAAELTGYDKLVAGVTLALEQQGDTLGSKFSEGSKNAAIQIRALKVEFEELADEIGVPLLEPIVASLRSLAPIGLEVGRVLGNIGRVVVPIFRDLAPLFELTARGLSLLNSALEKIPQPLIEVAAGFIAFSAALRAIEVVQTLAALGAFNSVLGITAATEGAVAVETTVLGRAFSLMLGPVGLAITALGIAAEVLGFFDTGVDAAVGSTAELNAALFGTASSATDLAQKLAGANTELAKQLATVLASGDQADTNREALSKLGLGFDTLATAISGSDEQYLVFLRNTTAAAEAAGVSDGALKDLLGTLDAQRNTLELTASKQADQLLASKQVTEEQFAQAAAYARLGVAQAGSINATGDYIAFLERLTEVAKANQKATLDQGLALGSLQQAFLDLRPVIAEGTLTVEGAQEVADRLGISAADAKAVIDSLTQSMNQFVTSGLSALPAAGAALGDFSSGIESAFGKLSSAANAQASAEEKARDRLAAANRDQGAAVAEAGRKGAAAVEEAQRKLSDAQAKLHAAEIETGTTREADVKRANEAVAAADKALVEARRRAGESQADAVRAGGEKVAAAQGEVNRAQTEAAGAAREAQDAYLRAIDPQRVIDQEFENALSVVRFQQNLETLLGRGRDNVVALLIAQGPEKGAALADALVTDDAKAKALDGGVALANGVTSGYRDFLEAHKAELSGRTVTLANGLVVDLTDTLSAGASSAGAKVADAFVSGFGGSLAPRGGAGLQNLPGQGPDSLKAVATEAAKTGEAAQKAFSEAYKPAEAASTATKEVPAAIENEAPATARESQALGAGATRALDGSLTLGTVGAAAVGDLVSALSAGAPFVSTAAKGLAAAASEGISGAGRDAGESFIFGLALGLTDAASLDQLDASAGLAAAVIIGGIKTALGIASPSRAGAGLGRSFIDGVAEGLSELAPVERATAALAVALVPDLARSLSAARTGERVSLAPAIAATSPSFAAAAAAAPEQAGTRQVVEKRSIVQANITLNRTDPDPEFFARELGWLR